MEEERSEADAKAAAYLEDLWQRLLSAALRHTGDIPSEDCLLYTEAANVIGRLAAEAGLLPEKYRD